MADKTNQVELKVTEESKVIELPKHKVSIFQSLLKNIKRYCKYLKLPQPEVKELGEKSYYVIKSLQRDGTYHTLRDTITDNYDKIGKELEKLKSEQPKRKYTIASQEVDVYDIKIIEEIKPENEWEILGVIDHNEGILTSAPNKTVPFKYIPKNLMDSSHCDHCNTKRFRNKTIFVQNTDTKDIKRVGGTCIRYYLGYDYDRILKIITDLNLFNTSFSDAGGWDDDDWYGGFGGQYYNEEDEIVNVKNIVKYFFNFVTTKGYMSKNAAEKYNEKVEDRFKYKRPTSQIINDHLRYVYIMPNTRGMKREDAEDVMAEWQKANEEYDAVIKKMNNKYFNLVKKFINERYKENNFLLNSKNFFDNGGVKIKHMKFIVSACSMYWGMKLAEDAKKAAEKAREEKFEKMRESEFVGTVGEKEKLYNLTITNISGFEGTFGWTSVYRLKDEDGNIFTKFGTINKRFITEDSPEKEIQKGAVVSFTAEIKKHDTWNDIKQTTLGRLSKI
jgi:hypothetical protein